MGGVESAGAVIVSRRGAGAGVERGAQEVIWRCNKFVKATYAILLLPSGQNEMPTVLRVGRYRFSSTAMRTMNRRTSM